MGKGKMEKLKRQHEKILEMNAKGRKMKLCRWRRR